jgi:hypothetical protein
MLVWIRLNNHLRSYSGWMINNIFELKLVTTTGSEIIYPDGSKNIRLAYVGILVRDYPDIN